MVLRSRRRRESFQSINIHFLEIFIKYKVNIRKTEEGCAVCCPGLPGCWSQGRTEKEALENIKDAIQAYLKTVDELTKDKKSVILNAGKNKIKLIGRYLEC